MSGQRSTSKPDLAPGPGECPGSGRFVGVGTGDWCPECKGYPGVTEADHDSDGGYLKPHPALDPTLTQAEDRRLVVAFTFIHHVAPVHLEEVFSRIERELGLLLGGSAKVVANAYSEGPDGRSVGSTNGTMTVVDLLRSYQAMDRGAGG